MPRRAAKVDANQSAIVKELRDIGASVEPLHTVGGGVPDLLVGYGGLNYLLEVKDENKPPSKRKLRDNQVDWHDAWRGQVCAVKNSDEAFAAIGAVFVEVIGTIS